MTRWIAALGAVLAAGCGGQAEVRNPVGAEAARSEPGVTPSRNTVLSSGATPSVPGARAGGIAARINNEILTWKDVDDTLKRVKREEITPELRRAKLRLLAAERLFLQAAKQHNVTLTEQELDDVMRREMKNYADEEEFERALRILGQTRTEYREAMRRAYLEHKLYQHLFRQAFTNPNDKTPPLMIDFVSPEELRRYYEEHREQFRAIENITVWRIGLQFNPQNAQEKAERRRLAESLLRKIEKGTDVYVLAHFYSDVRRGSTEGYGHRGLTRKQAEEFFTPPTVQLLFDQMKVGEISGIVEDRNTLNIFKLEQHINQREETFEEAQPKIRSLLENQKREANRVQLRKHLEKGAYLWPPDLFETE